MPKNIVILLDGTSNQISASRTNILRLYGTLEKSERQLVYYDPGVGTFGADNAWFGFWRKAMEFWGLLTGWGLDQNVKEAYRFLVENYDRGATGDRRTTTGEDQPVPERDRIYIFGFSRGAYSARVLAGFVHAIGLIEPRNLNLIDYAFRAYKRIGEARPDGFGEVRLYERILRPDRPPIRLLGLFDTVASIIEHGTIGLRLRSHAFTKKNRSVESVRHAIAIHERRTMFQPQLWIQGEPYWGNPFAHSASKPQDLREVWFTGVHTDVGGGTPEAESALAKIPLHWMIEQTAGTGLHYVTRTVNELVLGANPDKPYVAPDPTAKMHNSMNWAWALVEFIPQRRSKTSRRPSLLGWTIPLFEGRKIPDGASIHRSVIERRDSSMDDVPQLPAVYVVED
ncbi:MAG: hypothetical protein K0S54_3174 [Alphaproteobacteria bacterium]|nr:hypothetical protein [Alphaproteobacteria bacterium]